MNRNVSRDIDPRPSTADGLLLLSQRSVTKLVGARAVTQFALLGLIAVTGYDILSRYLQTILKTDRIHAAPIAIDALTLILAIFAGIITYRRLVASTKSRDLTSTVATLQQYLDDPKLAATRAFLYDRKNGELIRKLAERRAPNNKIDSAITRRSYGKQNLATIRALINSMNHLCFMLRGGLVAKTLSYDFRDPIVRTWVFLAPLVKLEREQRMARHTDSVSFFGRHYELLAEEIGSTSFQTTPTS